MVRAAKTNPAEPAEGADPKGGDAIESSHLRRFAVRTTSTLVMVGGFAYVIYSGHLYVSALVIALQVIMFKELMVLGLEVARERKIPYFRTIHWFFLVATLFALYAKSLLEVAETYFRHTPMWMLVQYHTFITFCLFTLGFLLFVMSLKKGMYRYQFTQFAWTQVTLLLIPVQSSFLISNIFSGLFWFVLPCSLVIVNDIWAYLFGFFFGKHSLIQLSPKKTWEGYLGAINTTIIWAFIFSGWLASYSYMVCPVTDPTHVWSHAHVCSPNTAFEPTVYQLPPNVMDFLSLFGFTTSQVLVRPVQLHAVTMACFASLIGPFGGFFASGFKRAFKIKDFGESIPGHGGITDRMDCQMLMGVFAYVYYQTFIHTRLDNVSYLLYRISLLDPADQLMLYNSLTATLAKS